MSTEMLTTFTVITQVMTATSVFISVPLYILVIAVIIKHRHKAPFNSNFFNIWIALGVVDIVSYILYAIKKLPYWNVDIALFKPYDQNNVYCCILYFCIWWFGYAQLQLTILISVNRFFSIVFSAWYFSNWTNKATNWMIGFIMVETGILAAPIFLSGARVSKTFLRFDDVVVTRLSGPTFLNPSAASLYNLGWKVHVYSIIAVCVVLYTIMFVKIRDIRSSNNSRVKMEMKLMYSAFVLFIANCLYLGYFIFRDSVIAQYQEFGKYSEWTLFILSDVYDLHNAYALLSTSVETRKAIWRTLKRDQDSKVGRSTAMANTVHPALTAVVSTNVMHT